MNADNSGMHVPSDSFGGVSPERKASQILATFFTFAAVKIVLAQMEGVGRGDLGSYAGEQYITLRNFVLDNPIKDGEKWLLKLMEKDELLGVRIMEVRAAYAGRDFEWENLARLAVDDLERGNVKIMRKHAQSKFGALLLDDGDGRVDVQGE